MVAGKVRTMDIDAPTTLLRRIALVFPVRAGRHRGVLSSGEHERHAENGRDDHGRDPGGVLWNVDHPWFPVGPARVGGGGLVDIVCLERRGGDSIWDRVSAGSVFLFGVCAGDRLRDPGKQCRVDRRGAAVSSVGPPVSVRDGGVKPR